MSSSQPSITSTGGSSNNISWPPGGGHQKFLLLHVPGLTDKLLHDGLSNVSNCCYIAGNGYRKKKFLHLPGVKRWKGHPGTDKQIIMEYLLRQGIEEGATKTSNVDKFRYQSAHNEGGKLLKNKAIATIVTHVTQVIKKHSNEYDVAKVSVLYSKANGQPQGGHYDDYRTKEKVEEEGEMLSVIVPLMDNTFMDIFNKDRRRIRVHIPKTMMLMFEGNVLHGGADYKEPNARLHLYFLRKNGNLDNSVGVGELCPMVGCNARQSKEIFTKSQLRDHWWHFHRTQEGKTLCQYRAYLEGRLFKCRHCQVYRIGLRMLMKHKVKCPQRHILKKMALQEQGGIKDEDEKRKDEEEKKGMFEQGIQQRKRQRLQPEGGKAVRREEGSEDRTDLGEGKGMNVGHNYNLRRRIQIA